METTITRTNTQTRERERVKEFFQRLNEKVENYKTRSAWERGVKTYALEMIESTEDEALRFSKIPTPIEFNNALYNGCKNSHDYSWFGNSLISNYDIAERLCTPSELKRTKFGALKPNRNEEWLDVQGRAIFQAHALALIKFHETLSEFNAI